VQSTAKSAREELLKLFPELVINDIQKKRDAFTNALAQHWALTLKIAAQAPGRPLKELAPMFSLSTSSIRLHLVKAQKLGLIQWPDHFKPVTKTCFGP
jgi:hypothetical protein